MTCPLGQARHVAGPPLPTTTLITSRSPTVMMARPQASKTTGTGRRSVGRSVVGPDADDDDDDDASPLHAPLPHTDPMAQHSTRTHATAAQPEPPSTPLHGTSRPATSAPAQPPPPPVLNLPCILMSLAYAWKLVLVLHVYMCACTASWCICVHLAGLHACNTWGSTASVCVCVLPTLHVYV